MKKLLPKIKPRKAKSPASSRITNDTVAEHREQILAGGRKFKYPIQYARHRLVFNAILISVVALIVVILVGWWQLYPAQNTSEFMYRVTKVVPVPVASVDGQPVLYSDYLMKYRSSIYYLEQKEQVSLKSDDGKRRVEYTKQQAMQDAIADAYAMKLAKQMGLTISDVELEGFLRSQRQSSDGEISEQTYDSVILDYYNWSPSEYRHATKNKLLRQKVTYAVDKDAKLLSDKVATVLLETPSTNLKDLSVQLSGNSNKAIYGAPGWVLKTNQDGGLANAAAKLKKGEVSPVVKSISGDGYYFVRLIDVNQTQVNYEYVEIPLTTFDSQLKKIISSNEVKEYIDIPKSTIKQEG